MKQFLFLVLAAVMVGYAANPLVSKKVNGFNTLVSRSAEQTDSVSTIYSGAISGVGLNGRKIIVGVMFTDTASAGTTTTAPTFDVDLQGSFDGTNFFNVSAAVINDDRAYGAAYATPGGGTADLSAWTLPWYRLALVPSASLGNTHSQYDDGDFLFYIAGLP